MMVDLKTKNLQNRKGNLRFRIRVPAECRAALGGKAEIVKALGLKEDRISEANLEAERLAVEWNEKFEKIRKSADPSRLAVSLPSGRQLEEMVRNLLIHRNAVRELDSVLARYPLPQCEEYLNEIKEEHSILVGLIRSDTLTEERLGHLRVLGLLSGYDANKPLAPCSIEGMRHPEYDVWEDDEDATDHSVWTLATALGVQDDRRGLRGILRALRDELEYMAREIINEFPQLDVVEQWGDVLGLKRALPVMDYADDTPGTKDQGPAIADVLAECLRLKKRSVKNEDAIKGEVNSFLEWHGLDGATTPIKSIKVEMVIDYRDNCLCRLLLNANKLSDTKDLGVREQVAYAVKNESKRLSITTVNNRLTRLGVVFGFAKKKHYVPFAVSEDMHLENRAKKAKLSGRAFDGYTAGQMNKLMTYLDDNRDKHKAHYEWRYWIPLLVAYTGCRANELAQLIPADVKKEGDIWYLEIGDDEASNQRIKTESSVRRVPLCQKILDQGFIAYVEGIRKLTDKKNPNGRLWPSLTFCEKNGWIRKPSVYFNQTVKVEIGAVDNHRGLHGIRSNVSRALQSTGVRQRVIDELAGHENKEASRVAMSYQGRLQLKELAEAVELLDWEKEDE
ncbi:hypothetical protein PDESU_02667 [Pontiella desulfatans]|uniref:Uncharacterized protein n=1 Tax=Pontiella desulfatans TaxID=2750659 RepID=A0A6C2U2B4_PONDE|nr:tyrosine-type recombinase/integrase [Pontiella desulfatans]VGO14110.1 hypothetical protein PDESU_02667 [Pontiella desulfatans]